MAKNSTISIAYEIGKPVADELGYGIWNISYYKEGSDYNLKYEIDKDGKISIDDCERFSRAVDKALDAADPIKDSYTLEVSSPGLGRKLVTEAHFKRFLGEPVKIRFIRPRNGEKEIKTALKDFRDKIIITETGEEIHQKDTAFVKLLDDENLF